MTGYSPIEITLPFAVAGAVLAAPFLSRLLPAQRRRNPERGRNSSGVVFRLQSSLEETAREMGLSLSAPQMLLLTLAVMLGGFAGLFVLSGQTTAGGAGAVFGLFTPAFLLRRGWVGRQRKIRQQLPAVLNALASLDEAGRPFPPALEGTLQTAPQPLQGVLRHVVDDHLAGVPFEDAFGRQSRRTGVAALSDIGRAAAAIRGDIGRPGIGGRLGDSLRSIAKHAMVEERTFGAMRAKTTLARASAAVFLIVTALCIVLLRWFNPTAYGPFTTTPWFWGMLFWGFLVLPTVWLLTRRADRIVS